MTMVYRILIAAAALALVILFFSDGHRTLLPPGPTPPSWSVRADAPFVVGGYGDNFAYSGKTVRPLHGTLELRYDPTNKTGIVSISVQTTKESGPIQITANRTLEGEVRLTSTLRPSDRVLEDTHVFGSTGRGAATLPETLAALAGWSQFDLSAGGAPVAAELSGEWALAEAIRRSDGSIRQSGLVYSPLLRDKTGFSNPKETQFVLVVHSNTADPDNAPPYALALDLVFTQVTVEERPQQTASRTAGS